MEALISASATGSASVLRTFSGAGASASRESGISRISRLGLGGEVVHADLLRCGKAHRRNRSIVSVFTAAAGLESLLDLMDEANPYTRRRRSVPARVCAARPLAQDVHPPRDMPLL